MLKDREKIREIIRILMESTLYFELSLHERYQLVRSYIND